MREEVRYFTSREAYAAAYAAKWGRRDGGIVKPPDLGSLKQAMAAAHPDRGGSNAAFIEARKAYTDAKRTMRKER